MGTLLFLILIFSFAIIVFNIQNTYRIRKTRAVKNFGHHRKIISGDCKYCSSKEKTIDLIGKEEYEKMNRRIDTILAKHASQKSICLNITCGPDTNDGSIELHKLLPGHEVQLVLCAEEGLFCVDLYHSGARIGRFTLIESLALRQLMKSNHIRGAYVAEQNCYGIETSQDIKIILFYESIEEIEVKTNIHKTVAKKGDKISLDFCEN